MAAAMNVTAFVNVKHDVNLNANSHLHDQHPLN
jgi:hypothetical protein